VKWHEHERLLAEVEEKLSEEEQAEAWKQFEVEGRGRSRRTPSSSAAATTTLASSFSSATSPREPRGGHPSLITLPTPLALPRECSNALLQCTGFTTVQSMGPPADSLNVYLLGARCHYLSIRHLLRALESVRYYSSLVVTTLDCTLFKGTLRYLYDAREPNATSLGYPKRRPKRRPKRKRRLGVRKCGAGL